MTSNEQNNDNNWNWGDLVEVAGGVSTVVKLLSLLKNARGGVQLPTPFEGPAVGIPMRSAVASAEEVTPMASQAFYGLNDVAPLASQAFQGLTETLPIIAPEIAEVAGAGLSLGPIGLGLGLAGLAGSGLYYLGKQLLDKNPNDRVAQSIVKHEEAKHRRAKHLSVHMFADDNFSQAGIV